MSLAPSGRIKFFVTGARGATFADVARGAGSFGVLPNDSDDAVNQKFADYAIQQNPGFKGDTGDTGPADNTYATKSDLADSDTSRAVASLKAADGQTGVRYYWTPGNFTGRTDVIVSTFDGGIPISQGAWVPQPAAGISTVKAPSIARSQQDQNEDGWSVYDFFTSYNKRQLSRDYSESAAAECTNDVNAALASGEYIRAPAGLLLTEGTLIGGDGLKFLGAGQGRSLIKKPANNHSHVLDLVGTTVKRNVHFGGFTIDVNFADAGIVMEYCEDGLFENIRMVNHPYWGINLGVLDGNDTTIRNKRLKFRNLFFDNTTLTYEHFLIFNSEDIEIDGFYGATGSDAIGIGLYQNVDRFTLRNFMIQNIKTAIYYSLSCRAIKIMDGVVRGTTSGIQGTNLADNGAFGSNYAENLEVHRTRFFNNTDCGLSLGALFRATVKDCEFEANKGPGILFDKGGIGVSGTPALERRANKVLVENCTFRNNNADNIPSINAPGIAFTGIGGDMDVTIRDCQAFDDRVNPQQLYPIAFVGPYSWQNVRVIGGNMQAYGGATTIGKTDDATIDVQAMNVRSVTTMVPDGVSGVSYVGTQTYDPPSLAAGARTNPITVTVTGARKGDSCTVTFDQIVGEVVADGAIVGNDTAVVYLTNRSGGAIDMAGGTLVVTSKRVRKIL